MKSILVLCEGNHCRSPIAEALLQAALGPEVRVASAGLNALEGQPPDPEAMNISLQNGLDIGGHRGRQWTSDMALGADLVLVMDEGQKALCEALVPSARGRVFLLAHWLATPPPGIPDPYLQGPEATRRAFELIHQSVAGWLPRLKTKQRSV
ncbi:MAG: low molecular weight phosphotyrosine protein phosphatase [Geothrix sp.]|uniref:low molecular weight protein-tyrosine-phosphatase n=1 Tax=Geothrix sp. TaxID=1962974 RepID=UPI0018338B40|nr:low molecular weight protein-tyrosine-phosphatase [Geothrix sp.]NWJ42558.1 low molecular weight phosphotyrosine protein phosphatase [Geothrix sp.]WIL19482.1 MAG: low molecular weight phosphotyrosine protein phosphatase [Geothrix sp.]